MPGTPLKVFLLAGKQTGCIGLLTLASARCQITGVVAYDETVNKLASALSVPIFSSIKSPEVNKILRNSDVLVSVHGREIVPQHILDIPRYGAINVHPCLYRYKGAHPIERMLQDRCTKGSVGVHRMTEHVDEGEVLHEEFVDVTGSQTVVEIYNDLYPYYSLTLLKALEVLRDSCGKSIHPD